MFVTTASSATLMASSVRASSRSDPARDDAARVSAPIQAPTAASPRQTHANIGGTDLVAQIRAQLEQDPDYQILRRAFALDAAGSARPARASEAVRTDRIDPASATAGSSSGAVTFQSISTQRLELSVRFDEAAFMTSLANASSQRLELNVQTAESVQVQVGDPLVLDLGGQGITTTGVNAGVDFDLNGDGRLERMSTVSGDSWFLALDWNANGRIDDGRELFGDQSGAEHGFAALARHDDNGDARIDAEDAIFARLRLVQLAADGSQTSRTLEEAGVSAIELAHRHVHRALDAYDHVAQTGRFTRSDGSQGEAADVMLGYHDLA